MGVLETSDYIEGTQFGKALGVYYAKSHDDDVAFNEHLHYAINLTREGLPNIYTDGNRQAPTLGDSGGAFPRHANTRPFGQFGDTRVPNLVHLHNAFARGRQHRPLGRHPGRRLRAARQARELGHDRRRRHHVVLHDEPQLGFRRIPRSPHRVPGRVHPLAVRPRRRAVLSPGHRRQNQGDRPARGLFRLFLAQPGGVRPVEVGRGPADRNQIRRPTGRHGLLRPLGRARWRQRVQSVQPAQPRLSRRCRRRRPSPTCTPCRA
jgi:hypothetical protein